MDDFMSCMNKVGVLLKTRELIGDGQLTIVPGMKYPEVDKAWEQAVMAEHVQYRTQQGIYAREVVLESAKKIVAHQWWAQYGSTTPHLQDMAMKILGHAGSATVIERIIPIIPIILSFPIFMTKRGTPWHTIGFESFF